MMKFFLLLALFLCPKAQAGIVCQLGLAHSEDLRTTISRAEIRASDSDLRSVNVKDFFIESSRASKPVSLAVHAVVVGWIGEEELTLAMFRKTSKRRNASAELISQRVTLHGTSEETLWFDSYKLDIKCTAGRSNQI